MAEVLNKKGLFLHPLTAVCCVTLAACILYVSYPTQTASADAGDAAKTIGLVLTVWDLAVYETPNAIECPLGLQYSEKDQWLALGDEERAELITRYGFRWNRGPNGENGITVPEAMSDPLPFREVESEIAYGFNLDGTLDGRATTRSCTHRKFSGVESGDAIDHQMYRVLGCAQGMRSGGFQREWVKTEFQTEPGNRILLEVGDVDDLRNDSIVQIRFYKGYDGLAVASDGTFLPGATHRVDSRFPPLFSTTGKIVDGMLTIEPVPVARFPITWIQIAGVRHIRDMRLQLKLTESGAKGLLGGYEDLQEHWNMWRRGASGSQDISAWSGASIYKAMVRLADGHPDPQTRQCTAISVAYKVEASRANIVHSREYPTVQQEGHDHMLPAAERELKGY